MFHKKYIFILFATFLTCNLFAENIENLKKIETTKLTKTDMAIGVAVVGGGVGLGVIAAPVVTPVVVAAGAKVAAAAVAAKGAIMAHTIAIKVTYYTAGLLKWTYKLGEMNARRMERNYLNKLIEEDKDLLFEEKLRTALCSDK